MFGSASPKDKLTSLLKSSGNYDDVNISSYTLTVKLSNDDPIMIDLRGVDNTSSSTQYEGVQILSVYRNAFIYKSENCDSVVLYCARGKEDELKQCLIDVAQVV